MTASKGIRNTPQNINEGAWYYENKGSILLIVWPDKVPEKSAPDGCVRLRIPAKLLRETLKRQQYMKRKQLSSREG